MELKGTPPFNTTVGAARNDAVDHAEAITAAKNANPEEWQALRLGRYWDGAVSLAVLKPESLKLETLVHPFINDELQPLLPGPNVVAILLSQDSETVEMRYDDHAVTVSIKDLPA